MPAPAQPAAAPVPDPGGGKPAASSRPASLWLALHLPWLAGEVLNAGSGRPVAVSEETRRGWLVYRASPMAREQGVWPGMTVSAAGVICPGLVARPRCPRLEERRLEEIGNRMLAFSPVVSLHHPETVLLEVRGSLALFGGLERLRELIGRKLEAAGHVHRIAGAPTPAAASCLAVWGRDRVIEDKPALRSGLGDMPLDLLDLDAATLRRLDRTGVRVLRDLWRLPADGLARRFGAGLVRQLDRLQGRRPDPRVLHEPPAYFRAALELDWATDDLAPIGHAMERLLRQWGEYLRQSVQGTTGFSIECLPERGGRGTRLDIGVRRISRDIDHLYRLALEHLARVRFSGPVAGLVLESRLLHPLTHPSGQLFETGDDAAIQWQHSEDLLAMRLGGSGLESLCTVDDHRPGHAWRRADEPPAPGHPAPGGHGQHRPLWLLDPPRPLPRFRSRSLSRPGIIGGPERVETGWWDRDDQRRDYYVATDQRGRRLWVFQDLQHKRWYLHGLFA